MKHIEGEYCSKCVSYHKPCEFEVEQYHPDSEWSAEVIRLRAELESANKRIAGKEGAEPGSLGEYLKLSDAEKMELMLRWLDRDRP